MSEIKERYMHMLHIDTGQIDQVKTKPSTLKQYLSGIKTLNQGSNVYHYRVVYLPDSVELDEFLADESKLY